jgi:hypothetical protein
MVKSFLIFLESKTWTAYQCWFLEVAKMSYLAFESLPLEQDVTQPRLFMIC